MKRDPAKVLTGVSLGGAIVLFALYGEKFWVQANAAWIFLIKLTETAPLGLAAFFASWTLSTMLVITLRRWVPPMRNENGRRFLIEGLGLLGAIFTAWIQMRGPASSTFDGVLFGILAGFMAPMTATGLFAIAAYGKHQLEDQANVPAFGKYGPDPVAGGMPPPADPDPPDGHPDP